MQILAYEMLFDLSRRLLSKYTIFIYEGEVQMKHYEIGKRKNNVT